MSRVSIKMIAKELGVSNATVSLVLNGKEKDGRVGKVVAEKIRLKAKELNYQPNSLARSLRLGRSQTIGLILADISNPFFARLAFHIQQQAEASGYTILITNTNEDSSKMNPLIESLKGRQVDGFIIVPTENGDEAVDQLVKTNIPVILLDRYFPQLKTNCIMVDNYSSAKNATELMIKNKCKKIAYVTYKNSMYHFSERKRGYADAMKEAQIYNADLIKEVSYSCLEADTVTAVEDLIKQGIDGVFFATDTICATALKHFNKVDPDTFSAIKLTSFDYAEIFDFVKEPISYILQPLPEMGRRAVDVMINIIEKRENNSIIREEFATKIISSK